MVALMIFAMMTVAMMIVAIMIITTEYKFQEDYSSDSHL